MDRKRPDFFDNRLDVNAVRSDSGNLLDLPAERLRFHHDEDREQSAKDDLLHYNPIYRRFFSRRKRKRGEGNPNARTGWNSSS